MKKTSILIGGNIAYSFSQWLILFYLIKYHDTSIVGIFGLAISVVTPIMIFSNFQIRSVQATDINNKFSFSSYHFIRLMTYAFGLLVALVITLQYENELQKIMLLIGLMKLTDSLSEVAYGRFQQSLIPQFIGYSKFLKGIVTIIILMAFVSLKLKVEILFFTLSICYLINYFLFDLLIVKTLTKTKIKPNIEMKNIKEVIVIAFPLMVVTFLGSINTNIPRYYIQYFEGLEALGFFVSFAYLINIGNIFVSSIAQVYLTPLAKLLSDNKINEFIYGLSKMIIVPLIIGLCGILIIDVLKVEIIELLYDSSYLKYKNEFIIILFAGLISYLGAFLGYGNVAAKNFKLLPYLGICWIVVTSIAGMLLIPTYGFLGAALALVVSNLFIFISRVFLMIVIIKRKIKEKQYLAS